MIVSTFTGRVWCGRNVGKYNNQTWNPNKIFERYQKAFKVVQTQYALYIVN